MNFSNSSFELYFNNEITKEDLLRKIGGDRPEFGKKIKSELENALLKKDGKRIEYLIYALLLTEEKIDLNGFVNVLNELLICEWHEQHENIIMILQKIHSPLSVEYIKKAISLKPQYLNWDDNFAFEVKCIWTLGYIKTSEAQIALEQIVQDPNEILSQNAKNQLKRM